MRFREALKKPNDGLQKPNGQPNTEVGKRKGGHEKNRD